MSDKQHAQLVLRGCDLTTNENNIGVVNNYGTNYTWKNINLRTVLGPMYDKYDVFNLTLKYIASSQPPAALTVDGSNVIINISGLPFLNQTYLQSHNCNTNTAVLGTYNYPATAKLTSNTCFYSSNYLTFGKNQEMVNINIFLTYVLNGNQATGLFPETVYVLDIFGIDKEDGNKNGMRL